MKLKPCPMCGGKAASNSVHYSENMIKEQGWKQSVYFGVNCIACGLNNIGLVGFKSPERAAEAWNRRVA